jgi:FKBP-type peptidyl-prolyl cis-trans isomerase FklB
MKYIFIIVLSLTLFFGVSTAKEKLNPKEQKVRISYSVGYQVGGDFLRQGKDINPEVLLKGVMDAMAGTGPLMTRKEMRSTLIELQRNLTATQEKKMMEMAEKNLEAGMAFLMENAKKEGVVTLPSGLQYKVIKKGSGKTPAFSDEVTVHYRGTLIDGTLFDSSHRRNKPSTFPVSGVIAGWTEVLQLMKEGSKWQLIIPPDLAYSDKRTGIIEPNSTLIFEVELISIKPAE